MFKNSFNNAHLWQRPYYFLLEFLKCSQSLLRFRRRSLQRHTLYLSFFILSGKVSSENTYDLDGVLLISWFLNNLAISVFNPNVLLTAAMYNVVQRWYHYKRNYFHLKFFTRVRSVRDEFRLALVFPSRLLRWKMQQLSSISRSSSIDLLATDFSGKWSKSSRKLKNFWVFLSWVQKE